MNPRELPYTHSCFVCGVSNPMGLQLRFQAHGNEVRTTFRPRSEHVGFKGVIHGGLLATVLDEILVWACAIPTGKFAFCAELQVRFLNPVLPHEELTVIATMTENKRGKIFIAEGRIINPSGTVCAIGTGKYMPIPDSKAEGMMDELIGDLADLLPTKTPAENGELAVKLRSKVE